MVALGMLLVVDLASRQTAPEGAEYSHQSPRTSGTCCAGRGISGRGALVRLANLPTLESVNGPDDLIQQTNDQVLAEVLDNALPYAAVAQADAVAAIDESRSLASVEDKDARSTVEFSYSSGARRSVATRCSNALAPAGGTAKDTGVLPQRASPSVGPMARSCMGCQPPSRLAPNLGN
jgi:hypothetical protein